MRIIVLAPDVEALGNILSRLSVTGASKSIAEVPNIVIPTKGGKEILVFAKQIEPLAPFLTSFSKICAGLFEIE